MDHQRLPDPCPLKDMEHVEGFDAVQERNLKSRKRSNPELSEIDKWREIYKILFPGVPDEEIPSHCEFIWFGLPVRIQALVG